MSESDDAEEIERDIPNRVLGLHASIEKAVAKAEETSSYRQKFESSDVQRGQYRDLPDRTLRRAMKDAEALGWIEKKRQQWRPGEKAEQYVVEPEPEPSGHIAREGPEADGHEWHLLASQHGDPVCGEKLDQYLNDDYESYHKDDDEVRQVVKLQAVCDDCLGI